MPLEKKSDIYVLQNTSVSQITPFSGQKSRGIKYRRFMDEKYMHNSYETRR